MECQARLDVCCISCALEHTTEKQNETNVLQALAELKKDQGAHIIGV